MNPPGRWDYQLGGPPDPVRVPCGCWDCAVMDDDSSGSVQCKSYCVACTYPEATIEDCATCGSMTWHDGDRCLREEAQREEELTCGLDTASRNIALRAAERRNEG